tara:strand:+ start:277 stop:456 length:180 start_codon:yes stop_codon:yes gene_type:complete
MIKNTNILPSRFNEVLEKVTSAKFIPLSISSNDIKIRRRFLLKSTPKKPTENNNNERNK